ncbi:response regulator [Neobacillus drentensis]|uniref:response regulator transcription factor n=1 Tax=Neobacillus drentensis TaxID=220684 RepID=UPI002FFD82E2
MKIMLVDDEPFALRTLKEMISAAKQDWDVVAAAEDGEEAISLLQKNQIDLVISDIRMPSVDGLDLSNYINKNFPFIKVILLTGYSEFKYAQQALRYGVIDYLLKPCSFESLFEAIDRVEKEILKGKSSSRFMQKGEKDILESQLDNPKMINGDFEPTEVKKNRRVIELVLEKLPNRLSEDLSLKQLAEEVYLSSTYLGRIFKEHTGVSFSSYLIQLRLEKAKQLLTDPALKIYEVSERVGYNDQAHFTHVFKKFIGITPQEYKMRL